MSEPGGDNDTPVLELFDFPSSNFTNQKYSDLTIRCQGRKFYVHKLVLATKSGFFFKACDPNSPWIEARTGVIKLDEEHPKMVEAMLEYCYKGSESHFLGPSTGKLGSGGAEAELRFYVHLHAMGDKYQIAKLKYKAFIKFQKLSVEALNSRYTGLGKPITPAGVARITREVIDTTHDTELFRSCSLRVGFLCEISPRIDIFRQSSRFRAEIARIEGFEEIITKINLKYGFRFRHCPSCGHRQAEDFRLHICWLLICRVCGQASSSVEWNRRNAQIDAAMQPDTEPEEEKPMRIPLRKKKILSFKTSKSGAPGTGKGPRPK